MRELHVTVAGLDFFGDSGPFLIGPDGFTGWDEGVETRLPQEARPQAHGSFDLPGFQGSRLPALSGHVLADSSAHLANLKDRFLGILNGGQSGRIQVARPWGTQWADCRLGAQSRFTEHGGRGVATFQMQLWCADPIKYGDVKAVPVPAGAAYVNLSHWGNTASLPLIVVAGAAAGGYEIQSAAGARYQVTKPLVSGTPHTIDMRDGMLQVDGAYVAGIGVRADVWRIPPGSNATTIRVTPLTTGTPSLTAYVTDSFI